MKNVRWRDISGDGREPVVVMSVQFLPRGSGNRNHVRRLGKAFENHPKLKPYVLKTICGSSRLDVHFRSGIEAGIGLMNAIMEARAEIAEAKADADQMKLPLGLAS